MNATYILMILLISTSRDISRDRIEIRKKIKLNYSPPPPHSVKTNSVPFFKILLKVILFIELALAKMSGFCPRNTLEGSCLQRIIFINHRVVVQKVQAAQKSKKCFSPLLFYSLCIFPSSHL